MRSRLVLCALGVLGLMMLLPLQGLAIGAAHQTPHQATSVQKGEPVPPSLFQFTPNQSQDKTTIINCSWSCSNGTSGRATTSTVGQCYAACAGACGNPCQAV